MGRAGSGPEFHVNSGSGRIESLHLSGRVRSGQKNKPTSNSHPAFPSKIWLNSTSSGRSVRSSTLRCPSRGNISKTNQGRPIVTLEVGTADSVG